jgi:hypothetical protein
MVAYNEQTKLAYTAYGNIEFNFRTSTREFGATRKIERLQIWQVAEVPQTCRHTVLLAPQMVITTEDSLWMKDRD